MSLVGFVLILSGVVLIACGIVILALAAFQLLRQIFSAPGVAGGVAPPVPGVNLADLTKLIEAIVKMPQWLLAIVAGDVQIWLGFLIDGKNLWQ
ncbi:hypothetical protein [Mesorhizobium sp. M0006]|uniref:hypothetical protein n=1 Tax=Mesorhizobium sp. M0006 TaxID=2956838 RepID=UPI0033360514